MKPINLSLVQIPLINIGLTIITKLEIDLQHINFGVDRKTKNYKKKARSFFSEIEIANIFSLLDGFFLSPCGKRNDYLYFAQKLEYNKKVYLLAFCIAKQNLNTAGVITFYNTKTRN